MKGMDDFYADEIDIFYSDEKKAELKRQRDIVFNNIQDPAVKELLVMLRREQLDAIKFLLGQLPCEVREAANVPL